MSELSEFFFAAHPAVVQLQTVEIIHPNFSTPLRFVRNAAGGIRVFHEDDAEDTFVYSYLPMEIKTLGANSSLDQSIEITLGDVGTVLPTQLELLSVANGFQTKPVIKYREYRSDNYTMTPVGAPNWTFDGVDDLIGMGNQADMMPTPTTPFSVSAWVTTTDTFGYICSQFEDTVPARGWAMVCFPAGQLYVQMHTSATTGAEAQSTSVLINDGIRHHVLWTYNGNQLVSGFTCYVDGVAVAMTTIRNTLGGGSMAHTKPFQIGSRNSNANYSGQIVHVSYWDKQLSGAEVAEVYAGGTPPDLLSTSMVGNLVSWWKINNLDTTGADNVIDYGPNGYDGTAAGGVGSATGDNAPVFLEPMFGPVTLEVNGIAFNKTGASFTATSKAFNRSRTGEIYDPGRFPMLKGFL